MAAAMFLGHRGSHLQGFIRCVGVMLGLIALITVVLRTVGCEWDLPHVLLVGIGDAGAYSTKIHSSVTGDIKKIYSSTVG